MNLNIGGGFLGTLTIIFVIAKLFDVINWSWWIVFLPALIGGAIVALILIVVLMVIIIGAIID